MAVSDTDILDPPKWRVHPIVIWLAACFFLWGIVGYFLFSLAPIVQCFGQPSDQEQTYCADALRHSLVRGQFRTAILRRQVEGYMAAGKYAEALKASDEIVAAGHAASTDYLTRGQAWSSDSKYAEAAAEYRMGLSLLPGNEDVFVSLMSASQSAKLYDDARRDGGAFIRHYPRSATGYSWLGWTDYLDGKYAAASLNLRVAALKAPETASSYNELALSLEKEGNSEEAVANYSTAISLNDSNETYLLNRALLYRDLNREAEAQADFKKSLQINRSMPSIVGLAKSYIVDGKYDAAEPLVREALAIDPADETALITRVRLDYYRKDYAKARQSIAALQKISPDNLDAAYWLASVEDDEGHSEKALAGYKALLDDWREDSGLRSDIGHVLIDLNRAEEAIAAFNAAITLAPEEAKGYAGRARAYVWMKRWRPAIADANTAISLDDAYGFAYARRAYAEWGLNDMAAARKDYATATALEPGSKWLGEEHAEFLINDEAWAAAAAKIDALLVTWPGSPRALELKEQLAAAQADAAAESE